MLRGPIILLAVSMVVAVVNMAVIFFGADRPYNSMGPGPAHVLVHFMAAIGVLASVIWGAHNLVIHFNLW